MKSKKGSKGIEASDSDVDDSDVDNLDDEEVSLGSMEEEDFGDEVEEEGGMFMDPDGGDDADSQTETGVPDVRPHVKKRKSSELLDFSGSLGSKQKKTKKDAAVFASAEEFGSMLDENAGSRLDSVGLNAMANTDRAGLKQLKWEAQRDDWIHGRDAKTLRRRKALFNKRKTFGQTKRGGRTFRKK